MIMNDLEKKLMEMDKVIAEQSFRIKLNELKKYSVAQLQQIKNTVDMELKTKQQELESSELERKSQQLEQTKQRTKRPRIALEKIGDITIRKKV